MSIPALKSTDFRFKGQQSVYHGKVRDVYEFAEQLVVVATDRISAFDVVLPKAIPFKGQVLNQIAAFHLKSSRHIVPNWLEATPDPNVAIGKKCKAYPVEMVVRGYLAGHAWREYKSGKRELCGVALPDGLKENDRLPNPIITPTTKAQEGHDEDISGAEIIRQGLVSANEYEQLEDYALKLFEFGSQLAVERGLILVDTKYEFGKFQDEILLIDEVHTPDSSRYFYRDSYNELQQKGQSQKQLSKEFVREWLMENGFQGKEGQSIPEMSDEIITSISERYIELYESLIDSTFEKGSYGDISERIKINIENYLN